MAFAVTGNRDARQVWQKAGRILWSRDFLKDRYAFYKSIGTGDATLARAQLGEFLQAVPAPFARGIVDSAAR